MSFPKSEMQETVSIRPYSGQSAYGPSYGDSYSEDWYMEPGFRRMSDAKGNEIVASCFAIAPATSTITVGDEVTWQGRRYEIIDAQPLRLSGAAHHVEVYLKSAGIV